MHAGQHETENELVLFLTLKLAHFFAQVVEQRRQAPTFDSKDGIGHMVVIGMESPK